MNNLQFSGHRSHRHNLEDKKEVGTFDVCDTVPRSVDVVELAADTGLLSEYDGGLIF